MTDQILIAVCGIAAAWLAGSWGWEKLKDADVFQWLRDAVPDVPFVSDDGGIGDKMQAIEHAERLLRYQVENELFEASQHLRKSIAAMYLTSEDKAGE